MGMQKKTTISVITLIIIVIVVSTFLILTPWESTEEQKITDVTSNPFLWRIEGENPSYLYGSIHLADERVLILPDIVIEAIDDADIVYTEVELDQETQIKSAEYSILPGDQTLYDLLPPDVANRLNEYLASKGVASTAFSQLKVWAVATSLVILEDIENLLNNLPLDQYIWSLAISKGKGTGGLETVEEQLDIFDTLSLEEQIYLLNDTLDDIEECAEKGQSVTGVMIDAYIEGDLEILHNLTYADFDMNNPLEVKLRTQLFTDRNYNMVQRISQLITDNPDTQYFFTIGAGHYYGEDGILELLENEGFTMTRIEFNTCESCDPGE